MWRLVSDVPDQLDALVAAAVREGVLLKRGAYQFGAVAHEEPHLEYIAHVMPRIMEALLPGPRRVEESSP
jgi:glutamate-1-semialdehyde 2,1-aminomutase